MKYFKDKNTNEVYAYDQEQIDGGWVKEGLVQMTDEEVSAHLAPKPLTTEQLAAQVRAERDAKIYAVRWRIERAKDELDFGVPLTEPLEPLLQHVQLLRDVPAQDGFPENVEWPDEP
jgi:hypothetical protein